MADENGNGAVKLVGIEPDPEQKILNLEEITETDDVVYAVIGGYKDSELLCIGSLSAGDLIEWTDANEGEAKKTAGLRLITKSLVDGIPGVHPGATGKRIASDKNIPMFRKKNHKRTEEIVKNILKHNGMKVLGVDLS